MSQTIEQVMSREVLTVRAGATLGEVARVLRGRNVGSALVVDEAGAPVGLISERELVDSVAGSRSPDQGQASTWTTDGFLALPRTTTLGAANDAMRDGRQRHAAVTDDAGAVIGILSIRDLLAAAMDAA